LQSSGSGLRLFHLVDQTVGSSFEEDDGGRLQRGSTESVAPSSWLLGPSSQAHDEGQTRRGGLPAGCGGTRRLEKKAFRTNAAEVLIYQDEVEIHRHPTLARVWAPVGTQPEVPAPGQNEKTVAYGGVDYATGRITYTIAPTKSGANFLAFLKT